RGLAELRLSRQDDSQSVPPLSDGSWVPGDPALSRCPGIRCRHRRCPGRRGGRRSAVISAHRTINSENAAFAFYDIESLIDAFTLSIYLPRRNGSDRVFVFHLREPNTDLAALPFDEKTAASAIREANPALPT